MQLCRYEQDGEIQEGLSHGHEVTPVHGSFFGAYTLDKRWVDLDKVRLLPPVLPGKVIAIGLNYRNHAKEMKMALPKEPLLFLKANSAVIGSGEAIIKPKKVQELSFEAELAIVVKSKCKHVPAEKANAYILGYTCLNDVTGRDIQRDDGQWARCKSFDTFCPMGPIIATELNVDQLLVESYLNGRKIQSDTTKNMIFSPGEVFSYVSHQMTLFPGDVIATGTPSGVTTAKAGDTIEIRIEGIGRLINPVEEEK